MLRREAILRFLDSCSPPLRGDHVLLGGALVAVLLDPERGTEDIDLVPCAPDPRSRLDLLEAADRAGLGVEAVNSAADFFLRRIPGWEGELLPLRELAAGRVLRPSARLFVMLKASRLTERDLLDCRLMIAVEGEGVDWEPALRWIASLPEPPNAAAGRRRKELARRLRELANR